MTKSELMSEIDMQLKKVKTFFISKQLSMTIAVIGLLCTFLFYGTARAATVGYWRFEDSFASEYNSPALDATAGTYTTFSYVIPNSTIIDGVSNYSNTKSFYSGVGTETTLNDYALLNAAVAGDFTVEAFIYLEPSVATHPYELIIANGGWAFGIDPTGTKVQFTCNNAAGTYVGTMVSDVVPLGRWIHVAAVGTFVERVGQTNYHFVQIYVDYVASGTGGYSFGSTNDGPTMLLTTDNGKFGAINPFEGKFDEVRVSDTALTPAEFLDTPASSAVAHWKFDNSWASEINSPLLDLFPVFGAAFDEEVPGLYTLDGNSVTDNTASYRHGAFGAVSSTTGDSTAIAQDLVEGNFTIEFFVKLDLGGIYRYDNVIAGSGWSVSFGANSKPWFYSDLPAGGYAYYEIPDALTEGQWHHVAFVGQLVEVVWSKYLHVDAYVDYVKVGAGINYYATSQQNPPIPCLKRSPNPLTIGFPNAFDSGLLDEIRLSNRALTPEEFLQADSSPQDCLQAWQLGYGLGGDINNDCDVDALDLGEIVGQWLDCYDPAGCP